MSVATLTASERQLEIAWATAPFVRQSTVAPEPVLSAAPRSAADRLVDEARATYERVSARAAYQLVLHARAVVVDIRPAAQRAGEGEIDGRLAPVVIERNVLEWRLDPAGDGRLPWVTVGSRVLVLCQEGFESSLAAASLVRLGLSLATDIVGGLRGWREAGLPVAA